MQPVKSIQAVLPPHDLIAFKTKQFRRQSEIITRPGLVLLKQVSDAGSKEFNAEIIHYPTSPRRPFAGLAVKKCFQIIQPQLTRRITAIRVEMFDASWFIQQINPDKTAVQGDMPMPSTIYSAPDVDMSGLMRGVAMTVHQDCRAIRPGQRMVKHIQDCGNDGFSTPFHTGARNTFRMPYWYAGPDLKMKDRQG